MNRLAEYPVARGRAAAGARGPLARAANRRAGIEGVATVGRGKALTRAVEVQPAHLNAVSDLPDAVEYGAMALVGGRKSVLVTERRLHGERDRIHHAAPRPGLSVAERGQGVVA